MADSVSKERIKHCHIGHIFAGLGSLCGSYPYPRSNRNPNFKHLFDTHPMAQMIKIDYRSNVFLLNPTNCREIMEVWGCSAIKRSVLTNVGFTP